MQDMTKLIMQGLSGFEEVSRDVRKVLQYGFWSKETCDYMRAWGNDNRRLSEVL